MMLDLPDSAYNAPLQMPQSVVSENGVLNNLSAEIGFLLRRRPPHLGSPKFYNEALPVIDINYKNRIEFSVEDGLKISVFKKGNFATGPVAEYRQSFSERLPRYSHKMSDSIEVGAFASYMTPIGEFEGRLRKAVDSYGGWSGDISYDTEVNIGKKWTLGGEIRTSWADNDFTNMFFGTKTKASHYFHLPQFLNKDYLTTGAQALLVRDMGHRTKIFATVSYDRLLSEEWRSPIIQSRDITTFGIGMSWHFGKVFKP